MIKKSTNIIKGAITCYVHMLVKYDSARNEAAYVIVRLVWCSVLWNRNWYDLGFSPKGAESLVSQKGVYKKLNIIFIMIVLWFNG